MHTYIIVGLGNPGTEYSNSRHNIGRQVVLLLQSTWQTSEWRYDKKLRAKISQGVLPTGENVTLVLPENYMNLSGASVAPLIRSEKDAERMIVVHDDIDLNVGTVRVAYKRGAGGHNGVRSIEKAIQSKMFVRVRIGAISKTFFGTYRKPQGAEKIHNYILRKMSKRDQENLEPSYVRAIETIEVIVREGRVSAMCKYNGTTKNKK